MARCVRLAGPGPWGFRISGGRDFNKPIAVSKVINGSKAELADLQLGDLISNINGTETSDMIHMEAQSKIKVCRGDLVLLVDRPEPGSPRLLNGSPSTDTFLAQRFQTVLHTDRDENQNVMDRSWDSPGTNSSPGSLRLTPLRPLSPTAQPKSVSPSTGRKSVSPVWSPREENKERWEPSDVVVKGLEAGVGGRRSLSPVSSSRPDPRVVRSADSSPWEVKGAGEGSCSPSSAALSQGAPERRPLNRVDKDSEVYKMIQENRAAREPPRQSTRFRLLQAALDTGQDVAAAQFPGRFSPSAPLPRVPKYHVCEKCGCNIVVDAVKIREGCFRHRECYACADCGLNLGMRGHFWVRDQMFCEKHALQRFQAAEGSS
uniref:PDZ and LIM domain protein 2 isoform X1 n=2 Tax=Pristiophorus japonicus TaxID=55135 RepID=UPI00398F30E3